MVVFPRVIAVGLARLPVTVGRSVRAWRARQLVRLAGASVRLGYEERVKKQRFFVEAGKVGGVIPRLVA